MSEENFYVQPLEASFAGRATGRTDTPNREDLFENALDLIADGIAVLRHDGGIVYANSALRHLAESNGDFRVDRNMIEFATPDLRHRLAAALVAVERDPEFITDFAVARDDGRSPYTV
jgi:PAS domain-containing protein